MTQCRFHFKSAFSPGIVDTLDDRYSAIDPLKLMAICRFVSRITHRPIAVDHPIAGESVFSHKSGIHCAAILKNPDTYQPLSPRILGRKSARLVVGRHSGSAAIKHVMKEAGLILNEKNRAAARLGSGRGPEEKSPYLHR